jgi:hypothetical protein
MKKSGRMAAFFSLILRPRKNLFFLGVFQTDAAVYS